MKHDVLTFDYSRYADLFEDMLNDENYLISNKIIDETTE